MAHCAGSLLGGALSESTPLVHGTPLTGFDEVRRCE
jgi:hypothetical protein